MFVRRGTASTWSCAAGTPFSSMAFDAHGNGFLYGPDLTITHNGGSTWVRSPASGIVAAVIATSRLLWMVTIECASSHVTSNGCPLLLQYSKNGGRSWLADTALPSSLPIGYPSLRALSLRMGVDGRLELMTAPQIGATNGAALLWQSSRRGKGWLRHEVPCGFTPSAVALAIGPAGELLAGCGSQPGAGQQLKSILVSTNDGMTWRSASHCRLSPAPSRSCLDSPLSDGYLGEVAAPTSSRFFLVGSRSPLLVSTDGGKSWVPSPSVAANSSGGTVQVRFVNPEVGFVIGSDVRLGEDPVIWRTHNGGDSWNVVVPRLF